MTAAVHEICADLAIDVRMITRLIGNDRKNVYSINRRWLMRLSAAPMAAEQEKITRVADLQLAPKILHSGMRLVGDRDLHFTLLSFLPGDDYLAACPEMTEAQHTLFGQDVARFLDHLHATAGPAYDIGPYEAMLPQFQGTWREGHQQYWERLRQELATCRHSPESDRVFDQSLHYLKGSSHALAETTGPVLLHNDFHPKNLLVDQRRLAGVIDWECSQFGAADYDLCHLVHWCVYPPEPTREFRPFLRALFAAAPLCAQVDHLAERLTIYQIEHELQQILWRPHDAELGRVPRLVHWLDGGVELLLRDVAA